MRTHRRRLGLLLLLSLVALPALVEAQWWRWGRPKRQTVVNAATCGDTDVQTAIDKAVNGGTVQIPSGTCEWDEVVEIPDTKGITVQGAGIGSTVIRTSASLSGNYRILLIDVGNGNALTRLTALTFDHNNIVCSGFCAPVHLIGGGINRFRIDHVHFDNIYKRGLIIVPSLSAIGSAQGTELSGLVDNNTFTCDAETGCDGLDIVASPAWDNGENLAGNLAKGWGAPFGRALTFGSNTFIYVESNTFDFGTFPNNGSMDLYGGWRLVFRYNTTIGTACVGWHGFDSAAYRGGAAFEVYGNDCQLSTSEATCLHWRSATGMIFDNTCEHPTAPKSISLATYRARPTEFSATHGRCDGSSAYDGNAGTGGNIPANPTFAAWNLPTSNAAAASGTATFTVTGTNTPQAIYTTEARDVEASNPITLNGSGVATVWLGIGLTYRVVLKNSGGTTLWTQDDVSSPPGNSGWPCLDQPGHFFDEDGGAGYIDVPSYLWNNSNGVGGQLALSTESNFSNLARYIAADRDYYLYTASFNGTSGVGRGVIASRPATCTTGVGYWATDEGEWNSTNGATADGRLYKCTATNTWSLYYTPYTFPHPLAG